MRGAVVLASLVALLPIAVPAQDSGVGAEVLELAVAPFEAGGPASAEAPAIAQALREALAARGVGRVLGPGELLLAGATSAEAVVEAARRAGAGAVVTGRVTQLGSRLSVAPLGHGPTSTLPNQQRANHS